MDEKVIPKRKRCYYDILGVDRKALPEDIKKVFINFVHSNIEILNLKKGLS
jgi:hypothetical protein